MIKRKLTLLCVCINCALSNCDQRHVKHHSVYILPEGYKGQAIVIFNQKNGEEPKYKNGKRVYHIPISGVLLTQFEAQDGFIDHEYYYLSDTGLLKLEEMSIKDSKKFSEEKLKRGIFLDGTVGIYGDSNDSNSLKYEFFVVSNYLELDSILDKESTQEFEEKIKTYTNFDW